MLPRLNNPGRHSTDIYPHPANQAGCFFIAMRKRNMDAMGLARQGKMV